ncbi:MAG: aromatic amino acid hydroxylase [Tumebacillaceae bacterium]
MEQEKRTLVHVPAHLQEFVVAQNYDKYTPIDQAVWRYVLRQNSSFLKNKGYGSYEEGLRVTGMSMEKIPNMDEMNHKLAEIGWGVTAVDGFIPPVAFFDFQAHGILPIAGDIRTLNHIAYTPAPDIIHEAAGHAPMLHDPGYAEFLRLFGGIGAKALANKQDHNLYEAIRLLSIVKEDPEATPEQVEAAEKNLDEAAAAVTMTSEASAISKLYWWTVEYGLIGEVSDPKIYGAGLLSSMGESYGVYTPNVEKVAFDLHACSLTDYNITKPQPQLYVCKDFQQLIEAVQEFAKGMAWMVGGTESLHKAVDSCAIATAEYSSGLQVSGIFTDLELDANGEAVYLKTTGGTALAVANKELAGHDKSYHSEGFGSPIGQLEGLETPLEDFTDTQLVEAGIIAGNATTLTFASGVNVQGLVKRVQRENGKIVLVVFDDCTVTLGEKVLFQSEWGPYDMAVGAKIVSVFAGAADREAFHAINFRPSQLQTKRPEISAELRVLHDMYQTVRGLRESNADDDQIAHVASGVIDTLETHYPNDWLLRVELLELLVPRNLLSDEQAVLRASLDKISASDTEKAGLIANGLNLIA